jgi:hypothetical protein
MAFQIRMAAVLRSVNFLVGFRSPKGGTPAKAFQTSVKRAMGQSAVALVNSFSVANATRLSCAAGAAAWAVMLLSVSIVNVVMVGRQPDVVAFQALRPQLVLLDGGAGVVAPVAFRDLARLADADRTPIGR